MKYIKILLIIFICFILQYKNTYSSEPNQIKDSLIVKIKVNFSNIDLSPFFSEYHLQKLIDSSLLDFSTYKNYKNKKTSNKLQSYSQSLSHIYLLEYKSKIQKQKLISTLMQTGFFDYVEYYPARYLCFIPNDSLFSEQYYMNNLKVPQAWDTLKKKHLVLVGVVDTGVDYTHPDLMNSIWENPGEIGLDSNGNDKRFNGIDDDKDGYIDDWHGWDFNSSDTTGNGQDNDPMPGHPHGTHVSGTIAATINNQIGIAGMCDSIKILPVKIGSDNPYSTSLINSYDGMLYAAKMGADIINCSWGGSSSSITEQEVINTVLSLGSAVIAAAGNNNSDSPFFPASYDGVISVAASDSTDKRAFFSNYNSAVDVLSPGVDIISTIPGNSYEKMMGTSMATPITVGVASMIKMLHPEYSPIQLGQHLMATTDNMDSLNPDYVGKLGSGRVDALKAVSTLKPKNIYIKQINVQDQTSGAEFKSNDNCKISLLLENVLNDIDNLQIFVYSTNYPDVNFSPKILKYGKFLQNSVLNLDTAISFTLPQFDILDGKFEIELVFYDSDTLLARKIYSFFVNPSYLTFKNNLLQVTFNSKGNIGFNDYPSNEQGNGFIYNQSPNLLFEGALMVCSDTLLSDVARDATQDSQDHSFYTNKQIDFLPLANPLLLEGITKFTDNSILSNNFINININQTIIQPTSPNNAIYTIYDVVNNTKFIRDSLYLGLYFDWDIGISGTDNITYWDDSTQSAIVQNVKVDSLPVIGIKMLSNFNNNFWAIDNDGSTNDNPGVWDGFTKDEKIRMLTSGIGRAKSSITDISNVISAGPIFLGSYDTVRVCFAMYAEKNVVNLLKSLSGINNFAINGNIANGTYNPLIPETKYNSIYPNPVSKDQTLNMIFQIANNNTNFSIELYDNLGNLVQKFLNQNLNKGIYLKKYLLPNLSTGAYYIVFKENKILSTFPLIVE